MGSEGYLINEFIVSANQPPHRPLGGSYENRIRFPVEIVRRVRERVGSDFILIYRLSMLDLVPGGSTLEEVVTLAKEIEAAGATIINTGIGWHEARIPTIATSVPRAAFHLGDREGARGRLRTAGDEQPHQHPRSRRGGPRLGPGGHGLHGQALPRRPGVRRQGGGRPRADAINTCIGCNQACLDHIFSLQITSCLVNPRACHETELVLSPTRTRKRVAVVGAGPAGLACSVTAA
ncbi:NADPH-dependent 2,4-dienoyl-CoA reductase [Streptomyces badius]